MTLPIIILGSIALSLLQIPQFSPEHFNHPQLLQLASWLHQASYGIMSLTLTIAISYKLSTAYKHKYLLDYSPIINIMISFVSFIGIILIDHNVDMINQLGVKSIAKAIICAILTTELIVFFYRKRLLRLNFLHNEINNNIHSAIHACLPAILIPFLTLGIYSTLFADNDILSHIIPFFIGEVNLAHGLSFIQSTILITVSQIVWLTGIHPSSLIEIDPTRIYSTIETAIYSRQFFDTYAHLGGAGSTLGLLICLLRAKMQLHRKIGLYAILPGVFNINELLIFGIPIVFNRYLALPFILAPLVTTTLARIFIEAGYLLFEPSTSSWNTPVIISGYLSGGYTGSIIQCLLIFISAAIYWPFFRKYESTLKAQKDINTKSMIKDLCNPDLNFHKLMRRQTPLAEFCRQLQADMKDQLGEEYFSMHYQPKTNCQRKIIATEALIRWWHPQFGNIPPCIFINIAETDTFIHKLGEWINNRCMQDINLMKQQDINNLQFAINVSPIQLTSPSFFIEFLEIIDRYNILHKEIELEITESQRLQLTDEIIAGISMLSDKGVAIAVDDFGMGYTSLKYLKSFKVDTIKLDGYIVKDVITSDIVKEIIRSLSSLTKSMNGKLVAEWVEDEEQFKQLVTLGCDQFQGAYFSMPISRDDFIALVSKQ